MRSSKRENRVAGKERWEKKGKVRKRTRWVGERGESEPEREAATERYRDKGTETERERQKRRD